MELTNYQTPLLCNPIICLPLIDNSHSYAPLYLTYNIYLINSRKKDFINDEQDLGSYEIHCCLSVANRYIISLDLFKFNNFLQLIKWKLYFQRSHTFIPYSRVRTPKLSSFS